MKTRTDIHKPSTIKPEDYDFIECHYIGCKELDPFECIANAEAMKNIRGHMERTGGRYSGHEHGGTCHVCGATALYLAVWHHRQSNRYIRVGEDCCQKMSMGDVVAFNPLRRAIANAKDAKAGKMKAKVVLEELELSRAWELFNADEAELLHIGALAQNRAETLESTDDYRILCDIVRKLIKYGDLSDKQIAFVRRLVYQVDNRVTVEAKRQSEHDALPDCPEGRTTVIGEVLTTKVQDSIYGDQLKMLVKAESGYKVWGTIPSCLSLIEVTKEGEDKRTKQRGLARGDKVQFTAMLQRSKDDAKFGFYKRPTKAKLLEAVVIEN